MPRKTQLGNGYNRPGFEIINHFTYGLVSDGDLMEGVAAEACPAGHLKPGKLTYLHGDNHVTLTASTQLTFTEDHARRFAAYGWHTQSVEDGNDLDAVDRAISAARRERARNVHRLLDEMMVHDRGNEKPWPGRLA